jgi:anti-sigma regulatory factor (Ser/Thr protein kinase)
MEAVIPLSDLVSGTSALLDIDEQSQIGAARRYAVSLGGAHRLDEDALGRLALIVTESATNIVRHAKRGVIVLRVLETGATPVIEVLALDKGPGIPDVERAMQDGYSTSGTAGEGLGAIKRLADVFDIYSQRGTGTALLARVGTRRHASSHGKRLPASLDDRVGAVCVPLRSETECGDAWRVASTRKGLSVLLVDGLGHGPEAALAAAAATKAFSTAGSASPEVAMVAIGAALHNTRGAALSMVAIDEGDHTLRFSGVGNVDARVLHDGKSEHLVPQNGIVGAGMPPVRFIDAAWHEDSRLVMHSDGISARWRMDSYPGLKTKHPGLVAGVIYRDCARHRDDVSVVVVAGAATEAKT